MFVGRERELNELIAVLDAAAEGRGRVLLVSGEPGIGKSRLLSEFASHAGERGARVVWGRSEDGLPDPPYSPWRQVLRTCLRTAGDDVRAALPDVLRRLIPTDDGVAAAGAAIDVDGERLRLFEAVHDLLVRSAGTQPLVVLLDDLHGADPASVHLLTHVARRLGAESIVVVCTYRDAEINADPQKAAQVVDLARSGTHISLRGLPERAVRQLASDGFGLTLSRRELHRLIEHTGGNPLFVDVALRVRGAEEDRGPRRRRGEAPHVRDAIRSWIRTLSADCRETLDVAAVVGLRFPLAVVAEVVGSTWEQVAERLEAAVAAGIVIDGATPLAPWRFAHGLLRDALYRDVPPRRRLEIHAAVGAALESSYGERADRHAAEISHHYLCAGPIAGAAQVAHFTLRAGERALSLGGWEDAVVQLRGALDLGVLDPQTRIRALRGVGLAKRSLGEAEGARAAFGEALELAREVGDDEQFGEAVLGFCTPVEYRALRRSFAPLLEEALERVADGGALRAQLLARLAVERSWEDPEESTRLAGHAVEVARESADRVAIATTLDLHHQAIWRPETTEDRLEVATEIVHIAIAAGDEELAVRGRLWRATDLLELGSLREADAEIRIASEIAERLRLPAALWNVRLWESMRAVLEGRFEDAEASSEQAVALASAVGSDAFQSAAIQLATIRREQGRFAELDEAITLATAENPDVPAWRCGLAVLHAELGRTADARDELRRLTADHCAAIPQDPTRIPALAALVETATAIGDAVAGEILADVLAPHADRFVVIGRGAGCWGTVARYAGMAAAVAGRHEQAVALLERAVDRERRLGVTPFYGHALRELGSLLLDLGDDRGPPLLDKAAAAYRELGMEASAAHLVEHSGAATVPSPEIESLHGVFRCDGAIWTLGLGDRRQQLPDTKGLRQLYALVQEPGREFHAIELTVMAEGGGAPRETRHEPALQPRRGTSETTILDDRARTAYRQRLTDLRDELDEAESWQDTERAAAARAELDAVTSALASGLGLDGRHRTTASPAERARVNVTRTIRAAIERIRRNDPILAEHLDHSVQTGIFCRYEPDPTSLVSWELR